MRTLLLMRGSPASGKTTFIRENGLENFTLSVDDFRHTVRPNHYLSASGEISQYSGMQNDGFVWDILFNVLEQKMMSGQFVVVDATHSNIDLTTRYRDLLNKYKYTAYVYTMPTSLEDCLANNQKRFAQTGHFINEQRIERTYALIHHTSLPKLFKPIQSLSEIDNFYCFNANSYQDIKIIGNLSGCRTVLNEALNEIKDDTLYIFTGNYLANGVEKTAVLHFLLEHYQKPNVILLESLFEQEWSNFIHGELDEESSLYRKTLVHLLKDFSYADLRLHLSLLYKKMRQCFVFEYGNQKYICTHAPLSGVPKLAYIPTQQMLSLGGKHRSDITAIYQNNFDKGLCQNMINIHSDALDGANNTASSISLHSDAAQGGVLKVARLSQSSLMTISGWQNTVYLAKPAKLKTTTHIGNQTDCDVVNQMIANKKWIETKTFNLGTLEEPRLMHSINFKEEVFRKGKWDDMTIKARGLFVDSLTGQVLMRSYNKFFNYRERAELNPQALERNLAFPVKAWQKYNGFLGLISVVDGKPLFASKKTILGRYADYVRFLFGQENPEFQQHLLNLAQKYQCTFIFEAIHLEDPHIIEYDRHRLVLIDVVENRLNHCPFHIDPEFSAKVRKELFHSEIKPTFIEDKTLLATLPDMKTLMSFMNEKNETEGYVFEDQKGFLFKFKTSFYKGWKSNRTLVEKYKKDYPTKFHFSLCQNDKQVHFMSWLVNQDFDKIKPLSIIELRKMFHFDLENKPE